jgi:uncharacterized protein
MRRIFRAPALLLLFAVAIASPAAAQRIPAVPRDGVADLAGVLSTADAAGIRGIIGRMRADPGVELAVLTVRSVGEYGAWTQEEFATGVYNRWRLGAGQRQDGVLVLLSVEDRFTRIELGDGVPASQDARMRAIVEGVMVPRFRGGDMSGGLHDGVLAVAHAFGAQAPSAVGESGAVPAAGEAPQPAVSVGTQPRTAVPSAPQPQPAYDPGPGTFGGYDDPPLSAPVLATLIFCGSVVAGLGAWIVRRNYKRRCAECGVQMARLAEADDDVYLDSGRRKEEVLGSVNYDVWHCPGCGVHAVVADPRWSRHDRCGECGYRTVGTTRAVVQAPTYDSSGSEQIEKACAHCGWTDVDVIHLPRKQRPRPATPSSSSSSGSSWSGGSGSRSGGGGSRGGSSSGRGSSGRW